MSVKNLNPFIYWAQNEKQISIKVDLKDVKDYSVEVEDGVKLKFSANGIGVNGLNDYKFNLDLYEEVDGEAIKTTNTDSRLDIFIPKIKPSFWPRLICSPQKPNFLKIDFDRWQSEDKDDDEEEPRDVMKDYPNLYGNLEKKELGFRKEQGKLVYLILYNLFQFVGFLYILIVISVRYYRDGPGSYKGTYEAVGNAFKFVQLLQYLEVMHPIFGYTKGSWTVPFMQVSGRAFVLFAMLDCEPRMQTKPVVFYLFTVWALVEVVRYPYYISSLIKREVGFLTWLRYTIWIPLYPLGALCEAIIILRNIPYFEETGRFSVTMPNKWNVTFSMPIFMYIYLVVLILPGIYYVMKHMQRARAKKLGKKNKFI